MSLTGKVNGKTLRGSINRLYELQGYSAYEVAVINGFNGTEEEWLATLKGEPGAVTHTDADGAVLEQVFVKKAPAYRATPETLLEVIGSAEAGATIQLAAGNYPLLVLTGERGLKRTDTKFVYSPLNYVVTTYPENLTIVGGVGVNIAGISITSGVIDSEIDSPHAGQYNRAQDSANADISNAILPSGLTFKDIRFTNHFSLRNACVDDLSIIGGTFAEGAYLHCNAICMNDPYGTDRIAGAFTERNHFAEILPKNMLVRDCTFSNVFGENFNGDACSAILIRCVNGIVVHRNTINGAEHNGIQIGGHATTNRDTCSTGKIAVTNNTISNTGSSCVHVHSVDNAEVFVMNNVVNTEETVHVRVNTNVTNSTVTCSGNRHTAGSNGTKISQDKISIIATSPAIESTDYPGCYYRTVNGVTEWINPPMKLGVEYRTTERFEGNPIYCQAFSVPKLAANSTNLGLSSYGIRQTALIRYNGNAWNYNASTIYWLPGNEVGLVYKSGATYLEGHGVDITGYKASLRIYYTK